MIFIVLIILGCLIFTTVKWLENSFSRMALISYIVENGFREPTTEDIIKHIKFVIKMTKKDSFKKL